jgi:hypothetical protein
MSDELNIESLTPDQAKVEIDKRLSDFESPYWDNRHPLHRSHVDEMRRLHEVAFPPKGEEPHDGLAERLEREGVTEEDFKKAENKLDDLEAEAEDEEEIPLTPEQEAGFKKLRGEWGNDFETRLDEARSAYQGIAETYAKENPEFKELMESSLGNEPSIIKLFSEFARQGREGTLSITCPHCGKPVTAEKED